MDTQSAALPSPSATAGIRASTSNNGITLTQVLTPEELINEPPTLRLSLHRRPNTDKKVSWNSGTVDNEHMGKKKSKCCCIYKKQRNFGESSSESDDDECDNCFGHVEKRKKKSHDKMCDEADPNGKLLDE